MTVMMMMKSLHDRDNVDEMTIWDDDDDSDDDGIVMWYVVSTMTRSLPPMGYVVMNNTYDDGINSRDGGYRYDGDGDDDVSYCHCDGIAMCL